MDLILDSLSKETDIVISEALIEQKKIKICFIPNMGDIKHFNDYYYPKINLQNIDQLDKVFPGIFELVKLYTLDNFIHLLAKGYLLIFIDNYHYVIKLPKFPKRNIEASYFDPTNIFESTTGFNDSTNDNLILIRQRIKSNDLSVEHFVMGELSMNDVYVIALKETLTKPYYKKIINTLTNTNMKVCNSINDINKLFQNDKLVPLTVNTGSPDTFVEHLCKNKVGIIIENSPVAAILPGSFMLFTSNKAEINAPKYYTIFNRIFIFSFFFLSLFLLGLFISLINFHPNDLLLMLIANIQLTERGTSFPMIVEIFIVLFFFEFYRLTVSRSPNNYVQNIVIIFGGLFIGQNAINSGTVGALALLLTSLSYISGFSLTNNPHLITSLSIFRVFILLMSFGLGLIGFIVASIITICYFINLKSVGVSFFEPFNPLNMARIKRFFMPIEKS